MASIQEHYSKIIRHYENAISIQDRLIEHNRQCGLPIEKDEEYLNRLRDALNAARRTLKRSEKWNLSLSNSLKW
ncbi:hypothetical protein X738_27695 [Mesorhizobium sp. LNHC209A00]|nr:hypothetical protein X738_27695 [Mesorhizobium sp. LNHC209A00]